MFAVFRLLKIPDPVIERIVEGVKTGSIADKNNIDYIFGYIKQSGKSEGEKALILDCINWGISTLHLGLNMNLQIHPSDIKEANKQSVITTDNLNNNPGGNSSPKSDV